jgi:hypothetical protein
MFRRGIQTLVLFVSTVGILFAIPLQAGQEATQDVKDA